MMKNYKIVALAGGVGGAKLVDGLARVLQPDQLTIIVNTADDFVHLGLRISPDLDTVCYTLAGIANSATGWGRQDETWNVFNSLKNMGAPDWFRLGDADLAIHILRTQMLSEGWRLSKITQHFCHRWGIRASVIPMSDDPVQTKVYTSEGELDFQEYFVHRKCQPTVTGFKFSGIENCVPAPGVIIAINQADAVIICPSNPWVSIDPILAVPGVREAILRPLVASISPIIGEHTIKGPAAKMFSELGIAPSALAVAQHYGKLIDVLVIDNSDISYAEKINQAGIRSYNTDILMKDQTDRIRLAGELVENISFWSKVI